MAASGKNTDTAEAKREEREDRTRALWQSSRQFVEHVFKIAALSYTNLYAKTIIKEIENIDHMFRHDKALREKYHSWIFEGTKQIFDKEKNEDLHGIWERVMNARNALIDNAMNSVNYYVKDIAKAEHDHGENEKGMVDINRMEGYEKSVVIREKHLMESALISAKKYETDMLEKGADAALKNLKKATMEIANEYTKTVLKEQIAEENKQAQVAEVRRREAAEDAEVRRREKAAAEAIKRAADEAAAAAAAPDSHTDSDTDDDDDSSERKASWGGGGGKHKRSLRTRRKIRKTCKLTKGKKSKTLKKLRAVCNKKKYKSRSRK